MFLPVGIVFTALLVQIFVNIKELHISFYFLSVHNDQIRQKMCAPVSFFQDIKIIDPSFCCNLYQCKQFPFVFCGTQYQKLECIFRS